MKKSILYSLSITLLTISATHSGTQTCHISDKDAKRIIAAAHQNLGKKPNPLKKIHTEGTLPVTVFTTNPSSRKQISRVYILLRWLIN